MTTTASQSTMEAAVEMIVEMEVPKALLEMDSLLPAAQEAVETVESEWVKLEDGSKVQLVVVESQTAVEDVSAEVGVEIPETLTVFDAATEVKVMEDKKIEVAAEHVLEASTLSVKEVEKVLEKAENNSSIPSVGSGTKVKKHVVIFEVEGGTDKGPDGHRKDTMPMVDMLHKKGWTAEVIFYDNAKRDEIFAHVLDKADGFISRINPGKYPQYTESVFFDMVRQLAAAGVVPMPHCDAVTQYGAKDSLVKLAKTKAGLLDTYAYYDVETLHNNFPESIKWGPRVLKQNRGSTGEGIWVVRPHEWTHGANAVVNKDTMLICTEMVDNHSEIRPLGDFLTFCEKYIGADGGHLVDQRFLPRIVEGELRVLMIGDRVIYIVHKKPSEGNLSATLFSGATYSYDPPEKWPDLVKMWAGAMPEVRDTLGGYQYPLIWTADFILDTEDDGKDAYRLGEINCSCVGFTSELALADVVSDSIIQMVEESHSKREENKEGGGAASAAAAPAVPDSTEAPSVTPADLPKELEAAVVHLADEDGAVPKVPEVEAELLALGPEKLKEVVAEAKAAE